MRYRSLLWIAPLVGFGCTSEIGNGGNSGDPALATGSGLGAAGGDGTGENGTTSSGDGGEGAGSSNPNDPNAGGPGSGGEGAEGAAGGDGPGQTNPDGDTQPGSVGNPTVAPTEFSCNTELVPASTGWRRLSRLQFDNTLTDLLSFALGDRMAALAITSSIAPTQELVPNDIRPQIAEDLHGTFRRLDQGVAQSHVDNWYAVSLLVGAELTLPERIETVVGQCATEDGDQTECIDAFVTSFGARALRRPLTNDEVTTYRGFYGDAGTLDARGYGDLIAGLLNAPQFLYLVEHGADEGAEGDVHPLDAFELAARLSYHFWDTMPDEELWNAAGDGSLLEDGTYSTQVERLSADARTRTSARNFFREWLKVENLGNLDESNTSVVFQAFAGDDLPTSVLRQNMIDEVVNLVDHVSWEQAGGVPELLSTQLLFPVTADLAALYGVDPSDDPVAAPNDERPGLLTRAAFLATGSANTQPIRKGVFIRENLLCDHIPPPPPEASAVTPQLSPEFSTREVVEALTETDGTACAACHKPLINPLGFATENYDGLGRIRTEQDLYDDEGAVVSTATVNTASVPQVVLGDMAEAAGAAELMTLIAGSGKAEACVARQYFRYTFGRWEDVVNDGCALEELRGALTDSASMTAMLRAAALSPAFRERTISITTADE